MNLIKRIFTNIFKAETIGMKSFPIKFCRLNNTVQRPSKRLEDGGVDIYANFEDDYIKIAVGETKLIPTQLKSVFHENYVVLLRERGSTGTKGLRLGAGVIDSGYRGEWFIPINNTSTKIIIISKGGKVDPDLSVNSYTVYPYEKAIGQAIAVDNFKWDIEMVDEDYINSADSLRGEGSLGASGK